MVLMDDNYATIVSAVEEGTPSTVTFANRSITCFHVISGNHYYIFIYSGRGRSPLTAIQILWLNLVTDGLPALALGVEPAKRCYETAPESQMKVCLQEGWVSRSYGRV